MVAMRVADEDMADRPPADRRKQRGKMGVVVGPGIDHRQIVAPDDVAVGAVEGERPGIVGRQPPHAGRDLDRLAVVGFEPRCRIPEPTCSGWASGDGSVLPLNTEARYAETRRHSRRTGSLEKGVSCMSAATFQVRSSAWLCRRTAPRALPSRLLLVLAGSLAAGACGQDHRAFWPVPMTLQTLAVFADRGDLRPQSRRRHGACLPGRRCDRPARLRDRHTALPTWPARPAAISRALWLPRRSSAMRSTVGWTAISSSCSA